ncbi:MAG TPA: AmmeMemoRadiSam system protein B [Bacteroidales bacterium]|nr:AmmeMemoRadiSam system protein B [Bacteroidales bacterium]
MKTVIVIIIALILPLMSINGQRAGNDRQPAVAGSFYPSGSEMLRSDLQEFFSTCKGPSAGTRVRAIIVPHAGYVFSGHTAAAAFAAIPSDAEYDNIFLIGASHRFAFEGAAVFTSGDMITPLGTVAVNRTAGEKLINESNMFFTKDDAHKTEHSLEVELPFIQYHLKKTPSVIPILIGTRNRDILISLASSLKPYFNKKNLFVISSDFSHYPSYSDAVKIDRQTSNSIVSGDPDALMKAVKSSEDSGIKGLATAMCGWTAGMVLMYLTAGDESLHYRNVEYTNSGDSPYGDKQQVVGYNAIIVEEKAGDVTVRSENQTIFELSLEEKKTLLGIARETIKAGVNGTKPRVVDASKLTATLRKPLGAFVTITINGNLRGCIGRFTSPDPLYQVVEEMAKEAAFGDPRFTDLTAKEYPETELEISVLGPMKKISDISEIVIGKHGIYIKKGMMSGTLLPQVASERGWSVTEFLGYCARDKAGIGWDGWKNAEIFIYEALVFSE